MTTTSTSTEAPRSLPGAPQCERYPYAVFAEGDRCNVRGWSDVHPATVVSVTRNGKCVAVRMDQAELAEGERPEFIPGGFAGHCTNQAALKWNITEDPDGAVQVFTLRKWRGRYVWTPKGGSPDGRQALGAGWRKFHDFNF